MTVSAASPSSSSSITIPSLSSAPPSGSSSSSSSSPRPHIEATPIYGFLVAAIYGIISVSMTIFNKAVLSVYGFNFPITIVALQSLVIILFLSFLHSIKAISLPKLNSTDFQKFFPLSIAYFLNVLIALAALEGLNVPVYNTLKRGTTIITLFGEWWFLSKKPSPQTLSSTSLLVLGALLAGIGDLDFDLKAYLYAAASCIMQTSYLLLVSKEGLKENSAFGILYYNSLYSMAFSFVYISISGELKMVLHYKEEERTLDFLIVLSLALILGALLNYSVFLCTLVNSALTTTIVGQLKMMVSSVAGVLFFGTSVSFIGGMGILLNTLGGCWYAFIKYNEQNHQPSLQLHNQADKNRTK